MADEAVLEAVWHNDGHSISLVFKKTALEVTANPCPFESDQKRYCGHEDTRCVFEYFVNLYGAECNVGVVDAHPRLDVAWAVMGNRKFLDESQLWFVPTEDEAFASFLEETLTPPDV